VTAGLVRWATRVGVRCLLALGARDTALACVNRVLVRDTSNTHALATRAHLLAERDHAAGALADLERLVQLAPQQARAWFNLGYLQESVGQVDEAAQSFARATAIEPTMDRAWYGLGLCHIRRARWGEAASALERTTALQPLGPHAWYQLARVHLACERTDEARRVLVHLRGFEPKVADQLERDTGLRAALN
jgi:Flp pilus assembly protein TadD